MTLQQNKNVEDKKIKYSFDVTWSQKDFLALKITINFKKAINKFLGLLWPKNESSSRNVASGS